MTNYLDAEHWRVAQLVDALQAAAEELMAMQLISQLKLTPTKDGNQFCFLYGTLPNDCVVGFGDTVGAAMHDFNKNFWQEKASPTKPIAP